LAKVIFASFAPIRFLVARYHSSAPAGVYTNGPRETLEINIASRAGLFCRLSV
jgi:hypothetical protein